MEKKRWVFIFSALCLVLAFSVSPVEAQICNPGNFCDRDGDGYIRDHGRCSDCVGLGTDCNDNSFDDAGFGGLPCEGGGEEGPGAGNGDGNATTPATITFMPGDIDSDGAGNPVAQSYDNQQFPGLMDVFIGSKANLGNIFLIFAADGSITQPLPDNTRLLSLDFGTCADFPTLHCGRPGFFGANTSLDVRAGFRVEADAEFKNGVYDILPGPAQMVPMRVQFHEDVAGEVAHSDNFFIHFDPGQRNCEDSDLVEVANTGSGMWTVSGVNITGCVVQAGPPHPEPIGLFNMTFSFDVMID